MANDDNHKEILLITLKSEVNLDLTALKIIRLILLD